MRIIYSIVVTSLLFSPAIGFAETLKYALVIGNNIGHEPTRGLNFAEKDAEKFYQTMIELGGIKPENAALLLGRSAPEVSSELSRMEKRVKAHARDASVKTLFIVYYSGHADGDVLELGDSSLPMAEVLNYMRSSSADVRLAFMDSCRSGKLVSMKGGSKGRGFDILVKDEISSSGYAIVTSSSESELSQESKEIRGAFFTHYLISALRGAGDVSNDGKVTLSEAYDYAFRRTLARTSVTVGGAQHPMYEFKLAGKGDIVLTKTGETNSRLVIKLPESGRIMVVDEARNMMFAEADVVAEETIQVTLTAGKYWIFLTSDDGGVKSATVNLENRQSAVLEALDFHPIELETGIDKGGIFFEPKSLVHTVSVGGMWRKFPLAGAVSGYGASTAYRALFSSKWYVSSRINWSTGKDVGISDGYNDVGFLVGGGYHLPVRKLAFIAEIAAGYEHMFQSRREGKRRHTSGFDYVGMLGISFSTGGIVIGIDGGVGARTFQVQEKGWVHRLDAMAILSLGGRWSK